MSTKLEISWGLFVFFGSLTGPWPTGILCFLAYFFWLTEPRWHVVDAA